MRSGAVKVETKGSLFWMDDLACEYLRLPKSEMPRERAEWSDERAGVLQDAVWHPMVAWRTGCHPGSSGECCVVGVCPGLVIETLSGDGKPGVVWAPDAFRVDQQKETTDE